MISELYQKNILSLAAMAHGAGRLPQPDATADIRNPLCGDHVILDIKVENGRITHVGHDLQACVLCQASASILAQATIGAERADIAAVLDKVSAMLTAEAPGPDTPWEAYRDMTAVRPFGNRHRCVTLPLEAALDALASVRDEA